MQGNTSMLDILAAELEFHNPFRSLHSYIYLLLLYYYLKTAAKNSASK